jgi:uncharacterized protein YacL
MKKKNHPYLSITGLLVASFLLTVFLGSIEIPLLSFLLYVITIVSTFYLLYVLVDKNRDIRDTIDLVSGNWHIVPMMIIFTVVMTTGFVIGMA